MGQIQGYLTDKQDSTSSDLLEVTVKKGTGDSVLLQTTSDIDGALIKDLDVKEILKCILLELQIMNNHNELITNERF